MKKIIILSLILVAIFLGVIFIWQNYNQEGNKKDVTVFASSLWPVINRDVVIKEGVLVVWGKIINQDKAYFEKSGRDQDDIYTNQTLEVKKYLLNPNNKNDKELIIKHLGGTVGKMTLTSNDPSLPPLDSYVLLVLVENKDKTYSIFGGPQGYYQTDDRGYVNSNEFEKESFKEIMGGGKTVDEISSSFQK